MIHLYADCTCPACARKRREGILPAIVQPVQRAGSEESFWIPLLAGFFFGVAASILLAAVAIAQLGDK